MVKSIISAMIMHGIDCVYVNDNLVTINGICVSINNGMASFGTCRFRFTDAFEFVQALDMEKILNLNPGDKTKISDKYKELIHTQK